MALSKVVLLKKKTKGGGREMCLTNVCFSVVYVSGTQTMDGGSPRHSVNKTSAFIFTHGRHRTHADVIFKIPSASSCEQ